MYHNRTEQILFKYKPMKLILTTLLLSAILAVQAQDNYKFIYQDYSLPIEERVQSLVSEMTLEEKIDQMVYRAPAIDRLGVPAYNWWNECLHGVARSGYATVFPQSISIAASWDNDLLFRVSTAISDEARAKYHEYQRLGLRGMYQGLTFWSPNINIFRDPRWGRGHETYGEDPFLTGQLGAQFVKGLQGDNPDYLKVVATAKHYAVHSGPEPGRHKFNAVVSERDLHETYLPAFRTLVKDANVYSVMGAYNQFRGYPCCANPILDGILRSEWGFEGYVVSDCGAISDFYRHQNYSKDAAEAAAAAVIGGTELNCGSTYPALKEAIERGIITEKDIDKAVERLFTARFKLGMFDPDNMVPYAQIPINVNASDIHSTLAREASQKSIVLLKNSNNTLPLSKNLKSIAVIGPNADNWEALVGNYNGIPKNPVTVLQGIKNKVEPQVKVKYAEGADLADGIHNMLPIPSIYLTTPDGKQGVKGEYFANNNFQGEPLFTRIDDNIDFYWELGAPDPRLPINDFSIRWTGEILAPVSGTYQIGAWAMPELKLTLDGKEIINKRSEHHAFYKEYTVDLEAGKKYAFVYEFKNWYGDSDAKLLWQVPNKNRLNDAVDLAESADAVVLVLGLSQRLEGEEMSIKVEGFNGGDRTNLKLPATQVELMKAVEATGTPTILVLLNGSALAINWANDHLGAILSAGYAGQEGGNAIADVLFGDYNPAGRLPVTYYKSVDQLPDFENYDMAGRTYRYFTDTPLYPFGFGLSYTNFTYSGLRVSEKINTGDKISVSVTVTNTGKMDGDEVVQLYLKDEKASTPRPIHQLEGFKRIHLAVGESKEVSFKVDARQLSMIDKKEKRVIEPGWFTVYVGGKQPGLDGQESNNLKSTRFKVSGKVLEIE